jgi:uncharacterized repeat protein (TIGR01451 family)
MRSLLCLGAAVLIGLLLVVAPLGGSAAPAPPTPSVEVDDRLPSTEPTGPADPSQQQGVADAIDPARLHPALQRALAATVCAPDQACPANDYLRIVIERKQQAIAAASADGTDRVERRRQVIAGLQIEAQQSSAGLTSILAMASTAGQARNVRSFWISPIIALEAQPALIAALSQRDDVVQIRLDEPIRLGETPFQAVESGDAELRLPWNLQMLDVNLAEQALGLDGTGVVVANIDTGVDWQHPALLKKYRGYRDRGLAVHWGNWHVSTGEPYLYPGDGAGHGTHTMGTIVGDDGAGNRLGVAPGARWIAVKAFDNSGVAYESWLHDAFEWVLAPEGDPDLAPDVVSNSWGSDVSASDRFGPDLAALRSAGILPVFAAGNEGPGAGTVDSPGSLPEALAVGAVDDERLPAAFSGRGPSPWGEVKPELAAPGVNVVSAFPGGGLAMGTGTSMATPHVAGVAALLLQANPNLTPDQLEYVLKSTSQPLGAIVPNNTTGWGLVNAYAAGLRITASGEISGRAVRADGGGIASPTVTAVSHDGSHSITVEGDAGGAFSIALQPGLYDVTGHAFGYDPSTQPGIGVIAGSRTEIALTLTAQPAGSFFGRISELETGAPLSATVSVEGTPVVARSDANTGLYSLALPVGRYTASVQAEAHRIGHIDLLVVPGLGQQADVALRKAPRVLLVDSGRWYYDSEIRYFEDALTSSDYPYALWTIRDPFGVAGGTSDRPTAETLAEYDVVIWSSPQDSPGLIEADDALISYLAGGGQLVVSGQDVAYWDGGGSIWSLPAGYFTSNMGLGFESEGNLADLEGVSGTPLAGLSVALNPPDSARQQITPDAAFVNNPLLTQPALRWPKGAIGGATAGVCHPWRAAWLGFGLEGAGPQAIRAELLDRLLEWFASPPAPYGLISTTKSAAPGGIEGAPLIGLPGAVVSQTIRLDNIGVRADTVDLMTEGGTWPVDFELPDGRHVDGNTALTLEGCSGGDIVVTVAIPPGQPRDASSVHVVHFVSRGDPTVTASSTVRVKTPAPILFVDDERWYNYQEAYTSTLGALELSYDVFNTQGGGDTPDTSVLQRYPLVVWTTGYDWYSPISTADEAHLSAYLDGGGRLLLSSQDALDVRGVDEFFRSRLGVAETSLSITGTEVIAVQGSPLGADLGPWDLTFPFPDWSDALIPTEQGRGLLQNERLFTVGVARPAHDWRTAFFAFPVETLDDAARRILLGRTVLWLSPIGESRLEAPPVAGEGSRVPITLTLGLASGTSRAGLRAVVPLPPETGLAPGSLDGPWQYDAAGHSLEWSGDLTPDETVSLSADLDLATGIPDGFSLPLQARIFAGDGITLTAEAPIRVDAPWLELLELAEPAQPSLHGTVHYTFTVTNAGAVLATGYLTDTLPFGLEPIAGSARSSSGAATIGALGLTWSGALAPGSTTTIDYRARVSLSRPGARLVDRAELTDQLGRRVVSWAVVSVPTQFYLPLARRGAP